MSPLDPPRSLEHLDRKITATTGAVARRLTALRERLVGEMTGDEAAILRHLSPDFELVRHVPGEPPTTTSMADFTRAAEGLAASGDTIWVDWDHLVADEEGVLGHGLLRRVSDAGGARVLTTLRVVVVLGFDGDLMRVEHLYSDPSAAAERPLDAGEVPSSDLLAAVRAPRRSLA